MIQRRLMVVAGGDWQVPLIRTAKAMGHYVINTNLHPDSPGFAHADIGLVADVLDRSKHLQFARELQPHGIITDQSDIAVPTVAYLCAELGLPGIGPASAEQFTNKNRMREFLREHRLPTPDFQICRSPEAAAAFASRLGYPVVLKPPANQSSRGVFKIGDEVDLRRRYPETLRCAPSGEVLVEKFLVGTELTVEGIKTHGRHHTLAISRKEHYAHNPMVASALYYAPESAEMDYEALRTQHDHMVEAMGLPFGITHAEYIFSAGRFFLVEVAARGGGTKISSDIVPAIAGVPTNELLIRMSLGERIDSLPRTGQGRPYAALGFLNFAPGVVKSVSGVETCRTLSGLLDIAMNFKSGHTIAPPADDRARHGYFIVVADSEPELQSLCRQIHAGVQVQYE